MAKTMYAIQMDFANACRQADELDQVAQNLSTMISNDFNPCLHGIEASWKGENARMFCNKGMILREHIMDTAADLQKTAGVIRQIAKIHITAKRPIMSLHSSAVTNDDDGS